MRRIGLHAVDAVGPVHALLLRIQALILPIKTLVLSGHQDLGWPFRHQNPREREMTPRWFALGVSTESR